MNYEMQTIDDGGYTKNRCSMWTSNFVPDRDAIQASCLKRGIDVWLQRITAHVAWLLGANALGDLKLRSILMYHLKKILASIRIILNLFCQYSVNGTTNPEKQHIRLQHVDSVVL